jgi:hypothetical protein
MTYTNSLFHRETIKELASKTAKLPAWKWLPGMLALAPDGSEHRVCSVGTEMLTTVQNLEDGGVRATGLAVAGAIPDFTDAATRGCLLHLVQEKFGIDAHPRKTYAGTHNEGEGPGYAWFVNTSSFWPVKAFGESYVAAAATYVGALVEALEH